MSVKANYNLNTETCSKPGESCSWYPLQAWSGVTTCEVARTIFKLGVSKMRGISPSYQRGFISSSILPKCGL